MYAVKLNGLRVNLTAINNIERLNIKVDSFVPFWFLDRSVVSDQNRIVFLQNDLTSPWLCDVGFKVRGDKTHILTAVLTDGTMQPHGQGVL